MVACALPPVDHAGVGEDSTGATRHLRVSRVLWCFLKSGEGRTGPPRRQRAPSVLRQRAQGSRGASLLKASVTPPEGEGVPC